MSLPVHRPPVVHDLKTIQPYFDEVAAGRKRFEIRFDDRGFAVGDWLCLKEWTGQDYTGREVYAKILYITNFHQEFMYVVMSIDVFEPYEP